MNLRIITKNYAADPEIRYLAKSILQPFGLTGPFRQRGTKKDAQKLYFIFTPFVKTKFFEK